ncbi:hypothetical protein HMPREF3038_00986 [Akkermansia sp. KLE1797]|nr:hypothetical protein HMPREF3038_00986 [Akkermansia sp. KLE1797]KXU54365.1 hypothetical protein HMPREF3039_01256 [Akkermansia sp. KLE1798]
MCFGGHGCKKCRRRKRDDCGETQASALPPGRFRVPEGIRRISSR